MDISYIKKIIAIPECVVFAGLTSLPSGSFITNRNIFVNIALQINEGGATSKDK